MRKEGTITVRDGRTVGFADFGTPGQVPVLWCHGGPGSRLEPLLVADAARNAGFRLIGIDRPGYGFSTPQPGRTIGGWVSDGIAVADHLGLDRFAVIGASTGGAYALALAAHTSRVIAAVACCAITDMRSPDARALNVGCHPVWDARDRDEASAIVSMVYGENGALLYPPHQPISADPSDRALAATAWFDAWWRESVPEMCRQGVSGYVDDRLADGNGWWSFDVNHIACPVTVLHGSTDPLAPVGNGRHTAAIVPGATLRIVDERGHFSILESGVEALTTTLERSIVTR